MRERACCGLLGFMPRSPRGGGGLDRALVAEIEEFLAEGWSEAQIAERLGLKLR